VFAGKPAARLVFSPSSRAILAAMPRYVIALLLLSVAFPASADDLSRFAGRYIGCAVSGNEWVPIATTLTAEDGTLSGSYVFIETPGRWVPGTLVFSAQEDNHLSFSWTDIYGTGAAQFSFLAGGARFNGFWTGGSDRFPWNGVRQGSGLPKPDCSAPVA
jgi:hypothetical protein